MDAMDWLDDLEDNLLDDDKINEEIEKFFKNQLKNTLKMFDDEKLNDADWFKSVMDKSTEALKFIESKEISDDQKNYRLHLLIEGIDVEIRHLQNECQNLYDLNFITETEYTTYNDYLNKLKEFTQIQQVL